MTAGPDILVIGIGEDGWPGLAPAAATALAAADLVVGSARQLALVARHVRSTEQWPVPMTDGVPTLLERHPGRQIAVLASGDPTYYGVGTTLINAFGADRVRILPHPSSIALACARLGWSQPEVTVLSAVGRQLDALTAALAPGRRLLVLVSEADGAARVCALATARGYGASAVAVLERLGGPSERVLEDPLADWAGRTHDPLAIVALTCRLARDGRALATVPGLPDDAYDSDGVLTKHEVRALTLSALAPLAGQLLWDVGAGSGSVAIEWMRVHPSCRAVAVESRADRRVHIETNARRLGVPGLTILAGSAPEALAGQPTPDAIFIGGGGTTDGVVQACVEAVRAGGRIVANGVTLETEVALAHWHARLGGQLTRITVSHAEPLGGFTAFRPALPITQWTWVKK